MSSSETPSLGQLLRETADMVIGRLAIHMPGKVLAYDSATQTATVLPFVTARRRVPDSPDLEPLPLPIINNVPVVWASWAGGAASIVGALLPGDYVLIAICDRSIDEWKAAIDAQHTPGDIRRCDLSDAMAFPGGRPPKSPLGPQAAPLATDPSDTVVVSGAVKLGSSAALDPIVTESRLIAALGTLATTFNTHTHATSSGATATPNAAQSAPAAGSLSSPDVKAT